MSEADDRQWHLDKKVPLLRSMDALSVQAIRILKLFGKSAHKVFTTVGKSSSSVRRRSATPAVTRSSTRS